MMDYNSISCSLYDVLEAAAVRQTPVQLSLAGETRDTAVIVDVFSRGGVEHLKGIVSGRSEPVELRLDAVSSVTTFDGKTYNNHARC